MPIIFCEMKLSMIVLNVGICWGVWGGGGLVYKLIYMVTFPGYNMEKEKNEERKKMKKITRKMDLYPPPPPAELAGHHNNNVLI